MHACIKRELQISTFDEFFIHEDYYRNLCRFSSITNSIKYGKHIDSNQPKGHG